MTVLNLYKFAKSICDDNKVSLYNKLGEENITTIYCGVTNIDVEEKFEQHVNDSYDMIDDSFNYCELTWYSLNDGDDEKFKYVNKITLDSLIKFVTKVYGKGCINEVNIVNDILLLNENDVMRFYVIWK